MYYPAHQMDKFLGENPLVRVVRFREGMSRDEGQLA